jgi:hypothetical protein
LLVAPAVWSSVERKPSPESFAGELFNALPADVKKVVCLPPDSPQRKRISANWAVTPPKISSFPKACQDLCEKIVEGLCSPSGYEKFKKQMEEDSGGVGDYHVAFFGKPGDPGFEFLLSGRHNTMRADGHHKSGPAFGGPMVYGHQGPSGDTEDAAHTGNVFWHQAVRANEVFKALDGKQRQAALLGKAPNETAVLHRKDGHPGLLVGDMSADQKSLVKTAMTDLLSPYRQEDVDEALAVLTGNGGLDKIRLAFYRLDPNGKSADNGNDNVWDVWRLEGPGFVWHFRGYPHVHVYVNIAPLAKG